MFVCLWLQLGNSITDNRMRQGSTVWQFWASWITSWWRVYMKSNFNCSWPKNLVPQKNQIINLSYTPWNSWTRKTFDSNPINHFIYAVYSWGCRSFCHFNALEQSCHGTGTRGQKFRLGSRQFVEDSWVVVLSQLPFSITSCQPPASRTRMRCVSFLPESKICSLPH